MPRCGSRGIIFFTAVAVTVLGAAPRAQSSGHPKRDATLNRHVYGSVRVIIRAQPGQSDAVASSLTQRGRSVYRKHSVIDAVTASVTDSDLDALDADPNVVGISTDAVLIAHPGWQSGTASTAATASTLLDTLGLPAGDISGKGVGIGVIDSGIDLNGDFAGVSFVDFTASTNNAYDDFGHGTHVSGLIASKGSQSQGPGGALYSGIAPKARIVMLKALDARGVGRTSTVIAAIEYAIVNRGALGIDVLNLSLGHPIFEPAATDPLVQAVEAASNAGITVIVAAGNVGRNPLTGVVGYAGILSPGNAPSAITVGALDTNNTASRLDDAVTPYSSRGPTWYDAEVKPDIVAPGHNLVSDVAVGSTLYLEHPDRLVTAKSNTARFMRMSGTSMASAVASGVAALVIDAARTASGKSPPPATVKAILGYTALPLSNTDTLTQGHGSINPAGAVALASAVDPSAPPQAWETSSLPPPQTTIGGDTLTWSQAFDFSPEIVWGTGRDGDEIVWGTNTVWGLEIVWGTGSTDGDEIVWGTGTDGDEIVWGTILIWGLTIVWGTGF
jgi:serine protease AprX